MLRELLWIKLMISICYEWIRIEKDEKKEINEIRSN